MKTIFTFLALAIFTLSSAAFAGTSYSDKKQGRVPFDNAAKDEAESVADIEPAAGAEVETAETVEEVKGKDVADEIKLPRKR